MTVQKGITQTGRSYINANDGLDLSYAVLQAAPYTGNIANASLEYSDLTGLIRTGNPAQNNRRPVGALAFLDERDIPNPNNAGLILNTLFRFQDINIGAAHTYDANTIYLLRHDPADLSDYSGDEVMAIITEDDAGLDLFSKGANTALIVSLPLIYDTAFNPASVSVSILQQITQATPAATTTALGTVQFGTDDQIKTRVSGNPRVFSIQKSALLFARTAVKNAVKALVGEMLSGNSLKNIALTYRSTDHTIDASVPDASTSTKGVIEIASATENRTATDEVRAVSPSGNEIHWNDKVHTKTSDFTATDLTGGKVGDLYLVLDD